MDHIAWMIVGSVVSMIIGASLHWLAAKDNCRNCGIAELKKEIVRLCNLVEALAEKAGMTVRERLEIQMLDKG